MSSLEVSEWSTNVDELAPQEGDLIEFDRGTYRHWALCIGKGQIVHFNPAESEEKIQVLKINELVPGAVTIDSLAEIAGTSNVRINNKDYGKHPRSMDEIRRVTKIFLNKPSEMKYCLVDFNCEHFVRFVKFGTCFSSQVDPVTGTMLKVAGSTLKKSFQTPSFLQPTNLVFTLANSVLSQNKRSSSVERKLEQLLRHAGFR